LGVGEKCGTGHEVRKGEIGNAERIAARRSEKERRLGTARLQLQMTFKLILEK
jgi:hypothetical protein